MRTVVSFDYASGISKPHERYFSVVFYSDPDSLFSLSQVDLPLDTAKSRGREPRQTYSTLPPQRTHSSRRPNEPGTPVRVTQIRYDLQIVDYKKSSDSRKVLPRLESFYRNTTPAGSRSARYCKMGLNTSLSRRRNIECVYNNI